MEITLLGFFLGLLLLAVPSYIIYVLDLHRMRRLLTSLAIMAGSVVATGMATYALVLWNNLWMTLLAGVLMVVAGAVLTIQKARLSWRQMIVPVIIGLLASVFIIGLYMLFLVMGLKNPFDAHYFVPVLGLLVGCTIGPNAHGLHIYYMGLYHHSQLYYYILGNGNTHRQATNYFLRRAFQASLNPLLWLMSGVVLTNAPVIMLALVMGGIGVVTAMALQMLLFVAVLASSFTSLFITLMVARRYTFDAYERLCTVGGVSTTQSSNVNAAPVSETLSSPSAPLQTDAGSRQPAK